MLGPVDISLEDVVDGLPEGEYNVNVVDAELKTSKAGNPYLRWQLTVFNHPQAKYNGQAIWHSTPTSGKGAFRLVQFYKAATQGQKLEGTQMNPQNVLGKQLTITVVNAHDAEGNPNGFTEVKATRPYRG